MATAMQALSSTAQSVESQRQTFALMAHAVKGLEEVMRSSLGPLGKLKMLVSASGAIKLTKDGSTLLKEMEIRHPVTKVVANTVALQNRVVGDGSTSLVILIANILYGAEKLVSEGVHSSFLIEGVLIAFQNAVAMLEEMKIAADLSRPLMVNVAQSCVRTKLHGHLGQIISEQIVDALTCIYDRETNRIDLHMVELMAMKHKTARDTELVRGIVMDHAARHPFMPNEARNCFILTANVSMEYEKTVVNAKVNYASAEHRESMAEGERSYIDKRAHQIVALKNQVCKGNEGFVVLNQGGIDPICLEILAKAGIIALRRVKRRNLERITLCCGGTAVSSTENLRASVLGHAGHVRQMNVGEERYTIVDEVQNPKSVTLLVKGPNDYTIAQINEAIHGGLMAVQQTMRDQFLLPGACAVELAIVRRLHRLAAGQLAGAKQKLGIDVFCDALEAIPKALAANAGFDTQDLLLANAAVPPADDKKPLGVNINSGELCDAVERGVYDSYSAKINVYQAAVMMCKNLMSVDAVIKSAPEGIKAKPDI